MSDKSNYDLKAKYQYHPDSTIHNPLEVRNGNIHTWTLVLNGEEYRVTREVWEAYSAELAAKEAEIQRLRRVEAAANLAREAIDLAINWGPKTQSDEHLIETRLKEALAALLEPQP